MALCRPLRVCGSCWEREAPRRERWLPNRQHRGFTCAGVPVWGPEWCRGLSPSSHFPKQASQRKRKCQFCGHPSTTWVFSGWFSYCVSLVATLTSSRLFCSQYSVNRGAQDFRILPCSSRYPGVAQTFRRPVSVPGLCFPYLHLPLGAVEMPLLVHTR